MNRASHSRRIDGTHRHGPQPFSCRVVSLGVWLTMSGVAWQATAAGDASNGAGAQINIARGAKYKCVVPPNYWGWKGPQHGDRGQLTDGKIVNDWVSDGKPIYELPSSAGWSGRAAVVVIDLGRVQPIGGVALHTVLSPWGPWWPSSIAVLVSDDNRTFYLVTASTPVTLDRIDPPVPPAEVKAAIERKMAQKGFRPSTRWYRSTRFQARGRYVALIMDPSPHTGAIVLDEIEVYATAATAPAHPRGGPTFTEGEGGWKSYRLYRAIDGRLSRDIRSLKITIAGSSVSQQAKEALLGRLKKLDRRRGNFDIPHSESFRAELPVNALHAEVFAVQAELWRESGAPPMRIWHSHRWAPLGPFTQPRGETPGLSIVTAQNSVRSDVFNLSNADAQSQTVELRVSGPAAKHMELFEIPLVDTHDLEPVAAALVPLHAKHGSYRVRIPAGTTRQVWLRFTSKTLPPGRYTGLIRLSTTAGTGWSSEVPVSVKVMPVRLADSFSLHLGGWDYPDAGTYQVTQENVGAYVRLLNQYGINTTWSRDVMPPGKYDNKGNLIRPPTRQPMESWLRKFPNAKLYCTVMSFSLPPQDPHRNKKLASWARDWSDYLQSRDVEPDRIAILIRDEPTTVDELKTILEVGRAIKRGEGRFKIWNDIHWPDPSAAPAVLGEVIRDACDIQCFNVQHLLRQPRKHRQWMAEQARPGLEWWTYTGGGSHRLTDPYVAFLLRSWFSFHTGLTGAHWWSFGDGNGGFSWNEYLNAGPTRSPLYLSADGVTASKSMEAMREGAQDYELLKMLKQRLEAARAKSVSSADLRAAAKVLNEGVPEVLSVHNLDRWLWKVPKDRSAADRVRVDILRLLTSTAKSIR